MAAVEIVYRYLAEPGAGRPMPADGAAAQRRLEAGNQAFATLLSALESAGGDRRLEIPLDARDVGLLGDGAAPAQRPYAALLGCADARVPTELIFGEGPNDLFVVRVAGNVLGQEVLGSLRYAADHLPLRAAVVLGHSGCGAVAAAVDLFQRPAGLLALATDHALRGLLDRLALVVQAAARLLVTAHGEAVPQHPGWRAALIEVAVALNAASGAYMLQKDLVQGGGRVIIALHGVYVVNSRLVQAADPVEGERPGLARRRRTRPASSPPSAPSPAAGGSRALLSIAGSSRPRRAGFGPACLHRGRSRAGAGPPASPFPVAKDKGVLQPHPAVDGPRRKCVCRKSYRYRERLMVVTRGRNRLRLTGTLVTAPAGMGRAEPPMPLALPWPAWSPFC